MPDTNTLSALIGSWWHIARADAEDYLAEYTISVEKDAPVVTARDLGDGEEFVISEISWDGVVLRFKSVVPSTGREGISELRLTPARTPESRFINCGRSGISPH